MNIHRIRHAIRLLAAVGHTARLRGRRACAGHQPAAAARQPAKPAIATTASKNSHHGHWRHARVADRGAQQLAGAVQPLVAAGLAGQVGKQVAQVPVSQLGLPSCLWCR